MDLTERDLEDIAAIVDAKTKSLMNEDYMQSLAAKIEKEQEYLHKLLDDAMLEDDDVDIEYDDEEDDLEEDDLEEDHLEEQLDNSDSEQEISDTEQETSESLDVFIERNERINQGESKTDSDADVYENCIVPAAQATKAKTWEYLIAGTEKRTVQKTNVKEDGNPQPNTTRSQAALLPCDDKNMMGSNIGLRMIS
ncbi:hypothetical protein JTB14_011747 [Gonioctena quinquepunctata]|nr:hypothetical protein JTB14_011747 [Gonioctena quinquepunctata]